MTRPPLTVQVREDPTAAPGDLVGALATLLLNRARHALALRVESAGNPSNDNQNACECDKTTPARASTGPAGTQDRSCL
jgi:hypothetical protein